MAFLIKLVKYSPFNESISRLIICFLFLFPFLLLKAWIIYSSFALDIASIGKLFLTAIIERRTIFRKPLFWYELIVGVISILLGSWQIYLFQGKYPSSLELDISIAILSWARMKLSDMKKEARLSAMDEKFEAFPALLKEEVSIQIREHLTAHLTEIVSAQLKPIVSAQLKPIVSAQMTQAALISAVKRQVSQNLQLGSDMFPETRV